MPGPGACCACSHQARVHTAVLLPQGECHIPLVYETSWNTLWTQAQCCTVRQRQDTCRQHSAIAVATPQGTHPYKTHHRQEGTPSQGGAQGHEALLPCRLTEGCAASHVAGRHPTCPMSADAATTTVCQMATSPRCPRCPLQALQPRYSINMPHPAPAANRDRTPAVAGATAAAPLRVVVGAGDADAAGSVTLPSAAGLLVAAPSAAALAALSAAALRWYSSMAALLEGGARMLSIRYTTQVGV